MKQFRLWSGLFPICSSWFRAGSSQ